MLGLALGAGHGDFHPFTLQQQLDLEQGHPSFCSCPVLHSQQQGQELSVTESLILQKLLCEGREKQSVQDMETPALPGLPVQSCSHYHHEEPQSPS